MDDLPIDIHYAKLLDWLVDRRKVPVKWHERIRKIRDKVDEALKDLPDVREVREYLDGRSLDYFACKKLVELLSNSAKDLFGRLKDEKARKWTDIVADYEREDVFLAEAAQILARQVDIEVSAVRKRTAKLQASISEAGRKEAEAKRAAEKATRELEKQCADLGVPDPALSFEGQLRRAVSIHAPKAARDIWTAVANPLVGDALRYYELYTERAGVKDDGMCTQLRKTREATAEEAGPEVQTAAGLSSEERAREIEIDWNDTGAEATIDFGEVDGSTEVADINFEEIPATFAENDQHQESNTGEGAEMTIDWGDENAVDPAADQIDFGPADGADTGQKGAENDGNNTASTGVSLLEDQTRTMFLTDLYELQAFLKQRHIEHMQSGRGGGLALLLLNAENKSEALQPFTAEKIGAMQDAVEGVIALTTSDEASKVFTLYSSSRALQRSVRALEEKRSTTEKMSRMADEIVQRREREVQELSTLGEYRPTWQHICLHEN